MALANGIQIGPYELLNLIGAGSMGEVYQARDSRLDRDVAIKVLPTELALDPDRLRRFEQEAKAVALLNHPNILHIYDTGVYEDSPYLVMELLQGTNLRERINQGPIAQKKALDFAYQIALGLAAAHAKGIVHRDLKPENCFVLDGERIKILDFGLAKFSHPPLPSTPDVTAAGPCNLMETRVDLLVGTAGYMSPEQVTGEGATPRSDIFALGIILWEMLSGERPFRGPSMVELLHAILKEEPQPLPASLNIAPSLQRILDRCLEKNAAARYQNAQDLAFALDGLKMHVSSDLWTMKMPRFTRKGKLWPRTVAAVGAAAVATSAFWLGQQGTQDEMPQVSRITFHNTRLANARLAPGGDSFVFGMGRTDGETKLWLGRLGSPGARPLGVPMGSDIHAISSKGEMALSLPGSVLALAPLAGGGAPRKLLEGVIAADWAPNGEELAIIRTNGGKECLEYPIGHVIYETNPLQAAGLCSLRVSPDGEHVVLIEIGGVNRHRLLVIGKEGKVTSLATGELDTPVWMPNGKEILCRERRQNQHFLVAFSLSHSKRTVYSSTETLWLRDVSKTGAVLMEQQIGRRQLFIQKGEQERDFSWLEFSYIADVNKDGSVLFGEFIEAQGPGGGYYRPADGSDAIRLGDGQPACLSSNGKWAVMVSPDAKQAVSVVPLGPGPAKRLARFGARACIIRFCDNDQKLLIGAIDANGNYRCFKQDIQSGAHQPWGPPSLPTKSGFAVNETNEQVALVGEGSTIQIYSSEGQLIKSFDGWARCKPIRWHQNGRDVFLSELGTSPIKVWRLDTLTGAKTLWKQVSPKTVPNVRCINNLALTPDGETVAYSFDCLMSADLFWMSFVKE